MDQVEINRRKFLDFLGRAEGADYDTIVGGKKFQDFSAHPNIVGLITKDGPSTGAGRYQITNSTYRSAAPALGISDFSRQSQDKLAVELIRRRGALADVDAGNFEAAINKLGNEWVSLPSSTNKNQSKRSWEWARRELNDPTLGLGRPGLPQSVTSAQTFGDTKERVSAFDLFAAERQREANANFGRDVVPAAVETFKNNNSIYNFFKTRALEVANGTPIDWNDPETQKILDGNRPDHWGYIVQAKTVEEAVNRANRVREQEDAMERLASMGTATKVVGGLAGSLPDVPTLLGFVPGIGLMSAASRASNAVRLGLAGAGTTLAYEGSLNQYKPLSTTEDLYVSTAMGLAVGAGAGLLINPKYIASIQENRRLAEAARRLSSNAQLEDLNAQGLQATLKGEQALHVPYADDVLSDVGLEKNPASKNYTVDDLLGVGGSAAKKDSVPSANLDSRDLPEISRGEMLALKSLPNDGEEVVTSARKAVADAFGDDVAAGLEESGRVKFLSKQSDLPPSLRSEEGVNALYDPLTDTTFLMADRINSKNVRGILLHDVGVHQGLERVVGTELYNRLIMEVDNLAKRGDQAAVRALERAAKSSTDDFIKAEEKLAYYLEHVGGKTTGIFRDMMANIKAFLFNRFGVDLGFNEKDLIALAQGSVRRVALDKKAQSFNNNFPFVWHGGPVKNIEKLSSEFVGTGEGNIAQGWGLYTASSKFTGNFYRINETAKRGMAAAEGGLYQLKVKPNVTPSAFLKWDSTSQSKEVQKALAAAGIQFEGKTGQEIYLGLLGNFEGETALAKAKGVSEYLDSLGIVGNEYVDGMSRKREVKSSNFVFFSDRHFDIKARYSVGDSVDDAPVAVGKGLAYANSLLGESAPSSIRSLASKLIPAPAGYKGNKVVPITASEDAEAWASSAVARTRKQWMPQAHEWAKENGFKPWQEAEAIDAFGEQTWEYVLGFNKEFPPQVVKAGDVIRNEYYRWNDHINNPLMDVGGKKLGLTERVVKNPETGAETIEGTLQRNPNFLPRRHDAIKWADVYSLAPDGRDRTIQFWANARRSVDPDNISEEKALRFGKRYVTVVEAAHANRAGDMLENLIKLENVEGVKDFLANMRHSDGVPMFSPDELQSVVDDLFPAKNTDGGAMSASLKHRNTINERYTEKWVLPNGEEVEVGLKNFVHTNVFDTAEQYYHRMSGAIALAKHADIYKVSQIDSAIEKATHQEFGGLPPGKVSKFRKELAEVFDHIRGNPREEFSAFRKAASMLNTYNVARLGGGFVFNQATELGQITGTMGLKNTLRAVPELQSLTRDLKTGRAPTEYLEYLENALGGTGAEYISRIQFKANDDWVRHLGDTKTNRLLDKADYWMKKTADGVLTYTGMTPLMIQQKRLHATALMNHFVDTAHGKASTLLTKDRLAWMGMSEDEFAQLKDAIKRYSTPAKGEFSDHMKLDVERFAMAEPALESRLRMAIYRESRRAIQENDLASTIPIMGTTLGKTVFQFMNFTMNAWNKQMLFAWNHRDMSTFNTLLHSSLLAYLAYTGRTYVQAMGMDEDKKQKFLDQRLETKQVVANTFGRLSTVSLLPNIYDSLPFTQPMFSGMRTTSDLSGIASLPTVQLLNDAVKASKRMGRNAMSDEEQTTTKDVKALSRLTPLNNVWPISKFWNELANDYPDSRSQ